MKKTILTLTASLLFGAAVVFAQDTTQQQTQQERYRTEGMVEVQVADLPEAVSVTLKDQKYQGWEDGLIYLDPETGEYLVVIEKEGEASQQYRFDRSGTDITDRNADQNQKQQDQDPVMQETDTTQQQDQNLYREEDNQQQNDQENQNDDAAVETDTTQVNQEAQNQDDQDLQNREDQTELTQDTTQAEIQDQNIESQGQDQEAQGQDESALNKEEGDDAAYRKDDAKEVGHMEGHYRVIEVTTLPEAVVATLEEPTYSGWKNNTVYLDTKTGDYIVQADAAAGESEGMYYRIDKSGKDISKHKNKADKEDDKMEKSKKDKSKEDKSKDDY